MQRLRIERKPPDALVLAVYERLVVGQPNIRVDGLWAIGDRYYVVCPDIDASTRASDGSPLLQWFFATDGWAPPPIELVAAAPMGARRIAERSVVATVELRGVSRIARDIFADLALAVGSNFPAFSLVSGHELEIHVERQLDPDQLAELVAAAEGLEEPTAITIVHPSAPSESLSFYRFPHGDLTLVPSRALTSDAPRKVRWLLEEDEDFWMSHRQQALLGEDAPSALSMFPNTWRHGGLRCVVDATVFQPSNIRSYLTLYDTVFLGLPLADRFDDAVKQLGTTARDLASLLETGRLKILLPQPIDRYSSSWLADALEVGGDNVVASRRLACGVLADTRMRMPFLHPPLEFRERRQLVSALEFAAANRDVPPDLQRWFRILAEECVSMWSFTPLSIQRQGALQTARSGVAWLAARLHKESTGHERLIEIMGASAVVEWAAALGAHAFPKSTESYSDEAACHLLAGLSSPLETMRIPIADPRVHGIVDGLLAIDNDGSAVEFAKAFRGADISRFRGLVNDLAAWNQDESYLQTEVERFNAEVRQYEKRPNRMRTMNITALATATAAELAPSLPHALLGLHHLPLGIWLVGALIGLGAEPTSRNAILGRLWDHSNGLLARTPARAVLVSRLRQQRGALK